MTLAPIYKRFEIEYDRKPSFVIGIGKDYLSYQEGYGVTIIFNFWNISASLVIWRFKDGERYKKDRR